MYKSNQKQSVMRVFRALSAFGLILSLIFSCCCSKTTNVFPEISETSTESESSTSSSLEDEKGTYSITIASPLSQEQCTYLAKLYVLKKQGKLPEGTTGENIPFDFLDSVDLPFVVNTLITSRTGCNADNLTKWRSEGSMPDIFLTDSFDVVSGTGMVQSLTNYMASDPLFSAENVDPSILSAFYLGSNYFGIPYQASVNLLFCDMEVLGQAGITTVNFRQDNVSFQNILYKLRTVNEGEEGRKILPLYQAQQLIPFLPCSLYGSEYISCSDDVARKAKAMTDSLAYIKGLVNEGYAYESLDKEEADALFQGMTPLLSRKVGVWVGSSDEIMLFDNYMPNTLNMMQMPGLAEDEYSAPLVTLYPLCVSSSCAHPSEAAAFASFLALDEDALLLSSRLSLAEGFLPVVRSPGVWKSAVHAQKYGACLSQYQALLDRAILIPSVTSSKKFQEDQDYISKHLDPLIIEQKPELTE